MENKNEYQNDLVSSLAAYAKDDYVRFHMPSHKGRNDIYPEMFARDINETFFSDNLNYPYSALIGHQADAAKIFGVRSTLFTVNGATAAVIASVMAAVHSGEKILVPTNSHVSCYYGALMAGAEVKRCYIRDYVAGISLAEIEAALAEDPDIKVVFITNPTFFGCSTDIKSICAYLKQKGIISVVDESHGTHFNFSDEYPQGVLSCEADIVINSGHKTINGLTQCALINIVSDRISEREVRFFLRMVQSTSPNYLLITSLISAIDELKTVGPKLHQLKIWYNETSDDIDTTEHFRVLNRIAFEQKLSFDVDPFKICVQCGLDTPTVVKILEEKYKILPEMVYRNVVVFMAGLNSVKEDYDRLAAALKELDKRTDIPADLSDMNVVVPIMQAVTDMRKAAMCEPDYVCFDDCDGRVSAGFVSVYPPGAPIIIPGDLITKDVIDYIHQCRNVKGLENNICRVTKKDL